MYFTYEMYEVVVQLLTLQQSPSHILTKEYSNENHCLRFSFFIFLSSLFLHYRFSDCDSISVQVNIV